MPKVVSVSVNPVARRMAQSVKENRRELRLRFLFASSPMFERQLCAREGRGNEANRRRNAAAIATSSHIDALRPR